MKFPRLITKDDIIETYCKVKQRGLGFILSKFTIFENSRTLSAFNTSNEGTSNWWTVPSINKRWNWMVSGDENITFQSYFYDKYFKKMDNIKVLSLGSGDCWLELELAKHNNFEKIVCIDIAYNSLNKAKKKAEIDNLKNIEFLCENLYKYNFPEEYFDVVIFNSSLHHFKDIDLLFLEKVKPCMKENGFLFLNEYVGASKLQFSSNQIKAINQAIQLIPKKFRKRKGTSIYKNKYLGSGLLRMYLADPSESVESQTIIPALRNNFNIVEEKQIGGNILMGVFKDIAYNFIELDSEKQKIIKDLFDFEDEYLKNNFSDYIVGLYQKPTK